MAIQSLLYFCINSIIALPYIDIRGFLIFIHLLLGCHYNTQNMYVFLDDFKVQLSYVRPPEIKSYVNIKETLIKSFQFLVKSRLRKRWKIIFSFTTRSRQFKKVKLSLETNIYFQNLAFSFGHVFLKLWCLRFINSRPLLLTAISCFAEVCDFGYLEHSVSLSVYLRTLFAIETQSSTAVPIRSIIEI